MKCSKKDQDQFWTPARLAAGRKMTARRATPSPRDDPPVITKGDVTVREAPESGEVSVGDISSRTVVWTGLYSDLETLVPARGTAYDGAPGHTVDGARLTRGKGGTGKLVITLVPTAAYEGTEDTEQLRSKIEIDFVQYQRPLLSHPKLNTGSDPESGNLAAWMEAPKDLKAARQYYNMDGSIGTLTTAEQNWAELILKGVESYLEFAPVVNRVRIYKGRPVVMAPGGIETPPGAVAGYQYLKTADRLVQNDDRSWTRTEQWTGAEEWEPLLYAGEG